MTADTDLVEETERLYHAQAEGMNNAIKLVVSKGVSIRDLHIETDGFRQFLVKGRKRIFKSETVFPRMEECSADKLEIEVKFIWLDDSYAEK